MNALCIPVHFWSHELLTEYRVYSNNDQENLWADKIVNSVTPEKGIRI